MNPCMYVYMSILCNQKIMQNMLFWFYTILVCSIKPMMHFLRFTPGPRCMWFWSMLPPKDLERHHLSSAWLLLWNQARFSKSSGALRQVKVCQEIVEQNIFTYAVRGCGLPHPSVWRSGGFGLFVQHIIHHDPSYLEIWTCLAWKLSDIATRETRPTTPT